MFNLAPVGRHYVQVCGTTPCWLRGADDIKAACRELIGEPNHVTEDGLFSWTEVECLGACVNAPVAQINKYYYEDLTPESFARLLADLKAGREITPGPQNGRQASAPIGGPNTLIDPGLYRNELPDDAPPNYRLEAVALTDSEAKRPGGAANQREAAVPKPPLAKGRKTKSTAKDT
jgi:NADH-quinone oxidoreductase subunit E